MPLPALMLKSMGTFYYMVSANFYTNHVGEDFGGRKNKKLAKQSESAQKGVRGRQGAAGAATNRSSMIFAPTLDGLRLMLNAELQDKRATFRTTAKDGDGRLDGHFTTSERYSILTAELSGAEALVDAQFDYGVALYPDERYRIVHFVGVHV